ncbi:MAG: tricarboxylate transporter [Betaproteobacteria bacterium]|nr:tricarboxylate transporter [Betaproteobacteria bacterium]
MRIFAKEVFFSLAVAATLAVIGLAAGARERFANSSIETIIPFSRGGGTDMFARYWMDEIIAGLPGSPQVKFLNVVGGGSTNGANRFRREARRDGSMLLAVSASTVLPFLFADRRVDYDLNDWQALLVEPTGGVVYASPQAVEAVGSIFRIKPGHKVRMQVQGATQLGMIAVLAMEILQNDINVEFGSSGAKANFRSFRDGLIDVDMQTTRSFFSSVQALIDAGKAVPLFSFGQLNDFGQVVRDSSFPDIPTFEEYYLRLHGARPSGPSYEMYSKLFKAGFPVQKALVVPTSTSPEVVTAYTRAIERASRKTAGANLMHGENARSRFQETAGLFTDEDRDWYGKWVKDRFNIRL